MKANLKASHSIILFYRFMCTNSVNLAKYRGSVNMFFFFVSFFLIVISPTHFFFPLYSTGTQLHIQVYILFSPIMVLRHRYLDIVLRAAQQDLTVNPFQKQQFASVNPKLPIPPTPSYPPPGQPQVCSPSP